MISNKRFSADVLLLCDHKNRELRSLQTVAQHLQHHHGLSTAILSINFHGHIMPRFTPRVVATPFSLGYAEWPLSLLTQMTGQDLPVVHLNWEQHIGERFSQYKMPRSDEERRRLYHIAWSNEYKEKLIKDGVPADHVRVCGNPQIENLQFTPAAAKKYREEIAKEIPLDKYAKLVFFPMNLIPAMLSKKDMEERIKLGFPREAAEEYVNFGRTFSDAFVHLFHVLAKDESLAIVIRPHPLEYPAQYIKQFDRLVGGVPKNVYFSSSHTVREWIAASNVVGSSWSTVTYDAQCIGKPSFLYAPQPRLSWFNHWVMDAVPNLNDVAAVRKFIADTDNLKNPQAPEIGSYSRNVADFLAEICLPSAPERRRWMNQKLLKHIVKRYALGHAVRMGYRPGRKSDLMPPYFVGKDRMAHKVENSL